MGIAVTSVLTLLTPVAAKAGVTALVVVRLIEGIFEVRIEIESFVVRKHNKFKIFNFQGVTFPCIHAIWSRWSPPLERSRMATIAFAGNYAGTVVSMPASGLLAQYFGWESLFYVFGSDTYSFQ